MALAEARLRSAHFNRNLSVIEAPLDGVVLHRLAEEREQVAAGQTVLVVGAHSRGHVLRVALADRDIVRVAPGDPAAVHIDAFPGQRWPARVSEVAGAAEPSSGLFTAELVLAEAPPRLVSGLVARVEIQPAASRPLVHVPIAALVAGDRDTASVYVVDGTHAVRRAVRVAFIGEATAALAEGVAAGERVVTEGALYLEDGAALALTGTP